MSQCVHGARETEKKVWEEGSHPDVTKNFSFPAVTILGSDPALVETTVSMEFALKYVPK